MHFTQLQLKQFRNYPELHLQFHTGTTVLYGANGSGKTNILEALHLLCLGRSHRTTNDREMMSITAENAFIFGETARKDGKHTIRIQLHQKQNKQVLLYGKPIQRMGDLMGHATSVLFSPEDLRIVKDGPSGRRRFLDMQLSQMMPAYFLKLKHYLQLLACRNALLKKHKLEGVPHFLDQLITWDEQLAAAAEPLIITRATFIEKLSACAKQQYSFISGNLENFSLKYINRLVENPYTLMLEGLTKSRQTDISRMFTSVGPHRDDIALFLNDKELRVFGSQGQMRTAMLSLKLAEIMLIQEEMGELPTLLLDDVFSELDINRRKRLLDCIQNCQTIITCTDESDVAGARADMFWKVSVNEQGEGQVC